MPIQSPAAMSIIERKIVSGAVLWNPTCTEAKLPQAALSTWLEAAGIVRQTRSYETRSFTDIWHWLEDSHQVVTSLLTTVPQSDILLHCPSFPLSFTGVRPTLLPPPALSPFSLLWYLPPKISYMSNPTSVCASWRTWTNKVGLGGKKLEILHV